jgi:SAM-dependent methyltransferase
MHRSVMDWVAAQVKRLGVAGRDTLEVGALDVNGSVRRLFTGAYVGVDMRDGPGVDIVCNAHDLKDEFFEHPGFGVVVCTEMLEHDDRPWESVQQMHAVALRSGLLIITARGYDRRGCFPLHDYPEDLWRYSVPGLRALLQSAGWKVETAIADPEAPGVFAVAYA